MLKRVRLLNLAVTLGLVVGLFAAALGTASAYGPETAGMPTVYFPWVANGDEAGGSGPWYSTVTVQNTEIFPVRVDVKSADGTVLAGNVLLNPRASKTWTAAALGVPAPGAGLSVAATWDQVAIDNGNLEQFGYCGTFPYTVTRSTVQGVNVDRVNNTAGATDVGKVYQGATTFVRGTDYTAKLTGDYVEITWLAGGARPLSTVDGGQYTVQAYLCETPRIAGVEKHATPAIGGNATTSDGTVSADGYSGVSNLDISLSTGGGEELDAQSRWVVPIVQTNTGWNTLLYVTNVSGKDNVGVTGTFYKASGQGYAGPSTMSFSGTMAKGETLVFDVTADWNLPEGTVGSVWIDADAGVVALVYRVKNETGMALTTVAQPRNDQSVSASAAWEFNPNIKYAALVMRDYNGWNTGINVANLSSYDNKVTITYYNYGGNVVAVESITVPPRAMEVVYQPATNNSDVAPAQITSAIIEGTEALAAAVDEVKYNAGPGQGQAMSYAAQGSVIAGARRAQLGRIDYDTLLALPLVQKGNPQTGSGETTGINLFNPSQSIGVTAYVQFLDTTGVPVAPSLGANDTEAPFTLPMGALSGATLYTLNYSEMPAGFVGSAVVGAVIANYQFTGSSQIPRFHGSLTGVSNNVNYDVQFDGSTVFNLTPLFRIPS